MTRERAKELGFNYLVELFGYEAYWKEDDSNTFKGTNWFNDVMINLCIWFYTNIYQHLLTPEGKVEYWKLTIKERL